VDGGKEKGASALRRKPQGTTRNHKEPQCSFRL